MSYNMSLSAGKFHPVSPSHPLNMLKALAGICLLHLTTIFFLFWATIDDVSYHYSPFMCICNEM